MKLNIDNINCDESILVLLQSKEVDSINFKNAIIQLRQLPFELPEFEKDIEEMIIEERFGNDYFGNLIIENYPNLQSIIVKKNSLKILNSMKVCNCDKLTSIEVEDGERWEENGKWLSNGSFYSVKNVQIEST